MKRESPISIDTPICLGVVGSPQGQEATSKQYCFWVARGVMVEETQLVVCESFIADQSYTFYGVVEEVKRPAVRGIWTRRLIRPTAILITFPRSRAMAI